MRVTASRSRADDFEESGSAPRLAVPGGVCAEGVWGEKVLEIKVRYYRLPTDEPSTQAREGVWCEPQRPDRAGEKPRARMRTTLGQAAPGHTHASCSRCWSGTSVGRARLRPPPLERRAVSLAELSAELRPGVALGWA